MRASAEMRTPLAAARRWCVVFSAVLSATTCAVTAAASEGGAVMDEVLPMSLVLNRSGAGGTIMREARSVAASTAREEVETAHDRRSRAAVTLEGSDSSDGAVLTHEEYARLYGTGLYGDGRAHAMRAAWASLGVGAVATASTGGLGAQLALLTTTCSTTPTREPELPRLFHLTHVDIGESAYLGATVTNLACLLGVALVHLIVVKSYRAVGAKASMIDVGGYLRFPSLPLYLWLYFSGSLAMTGLAVVVHPPPAASKALVYASAGTTLLLLVAVPVFIARCVSASVPRWVVYETDRSHVLEAAEIINHENPTTSSNGSPGAAGGTDDPESTKDSAADDAVLGVPTSDAHAERSGCGRRARMFFLGPGEWVNIAYRNDFVHAWSSVLTTWSANDARFSCVEYAGMVVVGMISSLRASSWTVCGIIKLLQAAAFGALLLITVAVRPHARPVDTAFKAVIYAMYVATCGFMALGFFEGRPVGGRFGGASVIAMFAAMLLYIKLAIDLVAAVYLWWTQRQVRLEREALRREILHKTSTEATRRAREREFLAAEKHQARLKRLRGQKQRRNPLAASPLSRSPSDTTPPTPLGEGKYSSETSPAVRPARPPHGNDNAALGGGGSEKKKAQKERRIPVAAVPIVSPPVAPSAAPQSSGGSAVTDGADASGYSWDLASRLPVPKRTGLVAALQKVARKNSAAADGWKTTVVEDDDMSLSATSDGDREYESMDASGRRSMGVADYSMASGLQASGAVVDLDQLVASPPGEPLHAGRSLLSLSGGLGSQRLISPVGSPDTQPLAVPLAGSPYSSPPQRLRLQGSPSMQNLGTRRVGSGYANMTGTGGAASPVTGSPSASVLPLASRRPRLIAAASQVSLAPTGSDGPALVRQASSPRRILGHSRSQQQLATPSFVDVFRRQLRPTSNDKVASTAM